MYQLVLESSVKEELTPSNSTFNISSTSNIESTAIPNMLNNKNYEENVGIFGLQLAIDLAKDNTNATILKGSQYNQTLGKASSQVINPYSLT